MKTDNRFGLGVALVIVGIALPSLVWLIVNEWIEQVAVRSAAPDQGAMLVAYLATRSSVLVGVLLGNLGLVLVFWRSVRNE